MRFGRLVPVEKIGKAGALPFRHCAKKGNIGAGRLRFPERQARIIGARER